MATKVKFDDKEYDVSDLSENARGQLGSLTFVDEKLKELNNMHALLTRAKNSYVKDLRRELISDKAGLLLDDD
jgi:hypothetical protein